MRRVRTFLCHGPSTIEILEGQTVLVGRGAGCDVVLDDDLASREHLRLRLEDGALVVRDLGSRNGILVNGLPVSGDHELHHGDHITAGRTPLSIVMQVHEPRSRVITSSTNIHVSAEDPTTAGNLYGMLEGSTRQALDAGDLTSAEGSGRSLLVAMRGGVARGRRTDPDDLVGTVELALDLAVASLQPLWLERALDLLTVAKITMTPELAARFAAKVKELGPSRDVVQAYLQMARAQPDDESAAFFAD